jgi:predicted SAM-dependent methyltransferase
LLEDFEDWNPMLNEWVRVLKPGGYLVILVPDRELFQAALAAGQPPNDAHRHESHEGEMSTYATARGLEVIEDRLTECFPGDYTIMGVFRKVANPPPTA